MHPLMERRLAHVAVERLSQRDFSRLPVDYYFVFLPVVLDFPLGDFGGSRLPRGGALLFGEVASVGGFELPIPNPAWTLGLGPVYVVSVGLPDTADLLLSRTQISVIAGVTPPSISRFSNRVTGWRGVSTNLPAMSRGRDEGAISVVKASAAWSSCSVISS